MKTLFVGALLLVPVAASRGQEARLSVGFSPIPSVVYSGVRSPDLMLAGKSPTQPPASRFSFRPVLLGAVVGAGIGAVVGHAIGGPRSCPTSPGYSCGQPAFGTAGGAAIGAALGATVGAIIGMRRGTDSQRNLTPLRERGLSGDASLGSKSISGRLVTVRPLPGT
jgi:uncharacterized membrane protein